MNPLYVLALGHNNIISHSVDCPGDLSQKSEHGPLLENPHYKLAQSWHSITMVVEFSLTKFNFMTDYRTVRSWACVYLTLPSGVVYICTKIIQLTVHTTYSWNIKLQECAGISGLWVLNEIIQKIVEAVWKLPAK